MIAPAAVLLASALATPATSRLVVLCYHSVADTGLRYTLPVRRFTEEISWLRGEGWQPVSLQQVLDARAGQRPLPQKAVLLTFDDGYADLYTTVFPILKRHDYPAVAAVVGSWLEVPDGGKVDVDVQPVPRSTLLSWEQIRELQASGLVELASHSWDLHRGVVANAQGNALPAAVTRIWRGPGAVESPDELRARVRADVERNSALIERKTGRRPRAMVWPYGRYSGEAQEAARAAGLQVMFTLREGANGLDTPLDELRRYIITGDRSLAEFAALMRGSQSETPVRAVRVDLDAIHDPDPAVTERNLSALIDRIARLHPSQIYLQAYADPKGDSVVREVYFPNRHLPMRADLFNRASWQLQTRAGVRVFAWMPVLSIKLPEGHPVAALTVRDARGNDATLRLSPFSPEVRSVIGEIYEDLAGAAIVDGIAFHDDAVLGDWEDAGPAAIEVYQREWGLPGSIEAIRADPALLLRWTTLKTKSLIDFTAELTRRAERYRKPLLTARSLFARPVLTPEAEGWMAQALPAFLDAYDQTAIEAMPLMEGEKDAEKFFRGLLQKVAAQPHGLERTVFELQARDWRTGKPVPTKTLAAWMRQLELGGGRNLAYYPDDPIGGQPVLDLLAPRFSLRAWP